MKRNIFLLSIVIMLGLFSGCDDYINEVDPLIDQVEDARLTAEGQVRFQITGVKQGFSVISSQIGCQSDLLSDALEYSNQNPDASFPQFEEINTGVIALNNNSIAGTWNSLHSLRFMADTLGVRVGQITFTNAALKNEALFTATFYGSIARFYLGTTFALTKTEPGACINAGPFIPSATLLDDALNLAKSSLTYTTDAYMIKVVNSFIAKIYLAKGDYANVNTYAAKGMQKNDADFTALNHDASQTYFWGFAGNGRKQIHVADRFGAYVKADPKEAARIAVKEFTFGGATHYYQNKYPDKSSAYVFLTWKENNLMLAETSLRGQGSGNALALVNEVRASYGIANLATVNLDVLYAERDKELFCQGTRLIDQHRFGKWHLTAESWKQFPIPQRERDNNSNF
ncbi:MAG: hypothetical protein FD178_2404 [Ignavibacteria bacterium]|nr:MAG: hypothetical protein FD178_2404 [Ignavibacteria bacterium]